MILHVLIYMRIFCFSQKLKLKDFICDQSVIELNKLEPAHSLCKQFGPRSGPEVIKLFSYSTQLSIKFIMLINVKMPTIVGILTFISKINTFICRDFSFL